MTWHNNVLQIVEVDIAAYNWSYLYDIDKRSPCYIKIYPFNLCLDPFSIFGSLSSLGEIHLNKQFNHLMTPSTSKSSWIERRGWTRFVSS